MRQGLRLVVIFAAIGASVASSRRSSPPPVAPTGNGGAAGNYGAPAPQAMTPDRAIGLWKSSFGPVKIAYDTATPGQVEGVWMYQRQGQDVIGYFHGALSGNVLTFNWSEPQTGAPLVGGGFLEFSIDGKTFKGEWWTQNRDRGGKWNGWRADNASQPPVPGTKPLPPAPQPTQPWPGDQPPPASPTPQPQPPTWNPNPPNPPPNTPTRGEAEQAPNPPPAHI